MTVHVAAADADRALASLAASGETARVIGEIGRGDRGVVIG
jgi:phosphoribosylaminoimidazole (AIR) synthetase